MKRTTRKNDGALRLAQALASAFQDDPVITWIFT
jgi:hypothetical protein